MEPADENKLHEILIGAPTVFSTASTPDINALVQAKLREYARSALLYSLPLFGVAVGGAAGYAIKAAEKAVVQIVEKEVVKEVPRFVDKEVIKYIDRVVKVPNNERFPSVCPKCGTNHWAYPPGYVGEVGKAIKK